MTSLDRTRCERVANRQIDAGSDVIFAIAGQCGLGALAVARTRGVLLRPGDLVLGVEDNYAVGLDRVNYLVSGGVWSKVVDRCSQLRAAAEASDS
ncbi:hypothetical protein BH20ACT13_BH20ACT13_25480 [soil metagenome]